MPKPILSSIRIIICFYPAISATMFSGFLTSTKISGVIRQGLCAGTTFSTLSALPISLWFTANTNMLLITSSTEHRSVTTKSVYHFEFFTHPNISVNGLLNFEEAHFYGFRSNRIVRQRHYSLSDQYYDFLNSLFLETEWRGTLFDTTPASVRGNMSNGALGFFSAQAIREQSLILE